MTRRGVVLACVIAACGEESSSPAVVEDVVDIAEDVAEEPAEDVPDTPEVTPPGCTIEGQAVAAGAANPAQPCEICDLAAPNAWTSLAQGTACGEASFCSAGACTAGCWIDGGIVATGTTQGCLTCDPTRSTTAWSPLAEGAECGAGSACIDNACVAVCTIDGVVVPDGATRDGSPCEVCVTASAPTAWSLRDNGAACDAGRVCANGECVEACFLSGVLVPPGPGGGSPCSVCEPSVSTTSAGTLPDGSTCNAGQVCVAGDCKTGCWIDGVLRSAGTVDPTDPCRACDPTLSTSGYSLRPAGTACGPNRYCAADGTCALGCLSDGTFVEVSGLEPGNDCHACEASGAGASFQVRPDGSQCASGTCVGGGCVGAPSVDSLLPLCASNQGGDVITIGGANFAPGASATVDGAPAAVTVNTTTQAALTVPSLPGVTGPVEVTVRNAFGSAAQAPEGFRLFNGVSFRPAITYPTSKAPATMALGDIDGDAHDDVALVISGVFQVWRNATQDGTFTVTSIAGCEPSTVAIADVTTDGLGDVIAACPDGIRIYAGVQGQAPALIAAAPTNLANLVQIVPGRFNGDAFVDLAVRPYTSTQIRIFTGAGDGTFADNGTVSMTANLSWLDVGDVNGDGIDDLAVAHAEAHALRIALGNGDGTFAAPVATSVANPTTVNVAPIDGDTLEDVVISSGDSGVSASYFLSTGGGQLGERTSVTGGGLVGAAVGDFNEDGLADVLVNGGGGIRVFPGNGDGSFSCQLLVPALPEPYYLLVGDMDGNGRLDILARNPNVAWVYLVFQNDP